MWAGVVLSQRLLMFHLLFDGHHKEDSGNFFIIQTKQNKTNQIKSNQNKTDQNKTDQNKTDQDKTTPNKTKQIKTKKLQYKHNVISKQQNVLKYFASLTISK